MFQTLGRSIKALTSSALAPGKYSLSTSAIVNFRKRITQYENFTVVTDVLALECHIINNSREKHGYLKKGFLVKHELNAHML